MKNTSPEVDRYIENAASFARPILERIRRAFHKAHPEITETMKWSFPHFEYKGLLGSMAAFKHHVSWGFWKAKLMSDPHGVFRADEERSMGGVRFADVKELPPEKVMIEYVREAVRLNEEGVKAARPQRAARPEATVPDDLQSALEKSAAGEADLRSLLPPVTGANTSSGSPKPSRKQRASAASPRPSSGSARGSRGTGSTGGSAECWVLDAGC